MSSLDSPRRRAAALIVLAFAAAFPCCCEGMALLDAKPDGIRAAPLVAGGPLFTGGEATARTVPAALRGATLLKIPASAAPGGISFGVDGAVEVYVCVSAAPPPWLLSWCDTGMTVTAEAGPAPSYKVYGKRFGKGRVELPPLDAAAVFVAARELVPKTPRKGWVLLTYDMAYLRDVISRAPEYGINQIQLSHDIVMNAYQVLDEPSRRADISALVDLAHAYGVSEVLLWTHEINSRGLKKKLRAPKGHPAAGAPDGNNPGLWLWLKERYRDLFAAAAGVPEADGVVLTFSEVDGKVYMHDIPGGKNDRPRFKHDGFTPAQSVAMLINAVNEALEPLGKSLYARTWGDSFNKWEEGILRDGIKLSGNRRVWIMNKNTGGIDWPYMDTRQPLIGSLSAEFNELVEFDLGFEYFDHGTATCAMPAYIREHWGEARRKGADGAAARIDRGGGISLYTANQVNLYAFARLLDEPSLDPMTLIMEWCRGRFPKEAVRDLAESFYDPSGPRPGDTRLMTWEAYFPKLAPIDAAEAERMAAAALLKIDKHRAVLEKQATLDTRAGRHDYAVLRGGIEAVLRKLGK